LGVVRKYTAWFNHRAGTPITTLHYFSELIEETGRIETSVGYWEYVRRKTVALESRWRKLLEETALGETK
jgi:hypothetical protein